MKKKNFPQSLIVPVYLLHFYSVVIHTLFSSMFYLLFYYIFYKGFIFKTFFFVSCMWKIYINAVLKKVSKRELFQFKMREKKSSKKLYRKSNSFLFKIQLEKHFLFLWNSAKVSSQIIRLPVYYLSFWEKILSIMLKRFFVNLYFFFLSFLKRFFIIFFFWIH